MKKSLATLALVLALIVSTTTYAETGSGKDGLFGFMRDKESSQKSSDDTQSDDRGGLRVKSETRVDSTKSRDDGIGVSVQAGASLEVRRDRAVADIDRRIASLNKLTARIEQMVRVSATTKKSLKATIDAEIKVLTDLREKIKSDTDEATLKADIASITKAYRVYMLVMPQITILSAADRLTTTADTMTTFGTKLDTRIKEAATAGKDVRALTSVYADMNVHIAEAKADASAAVTLTANLKPDNGDKALMEANKKALTEARAKIKAGHDNLKAARADAETIIKGLKSLNITVGATATTTR